MKILFISYQLNDLSSSVLGSFPNMRKPQFPTTCQQALCCPCVYICTFNYVLPHRFDCMGVSLYGKEVSVHF